MTTEHQPTENKPKISRTTPAPTPITSDQSDFQQMSLPMLSTLQRTIGNHAVQQILSQDSKTIQRLPKLDAFKEMSGGDEDRNKVLPVDNALTAFLAAVGIPARRAELVKVIAACTTYLGLGMTARRKDGVRKLKTFAEMEMESADKYITGMAAGSEKDKLQDMVDAMDLYNKASYAGDSCDYLHDPIAKEISDTVKIMETTPLGKQALKTFMDADIARLEAVMNDKKAPKILREILQELLANKDDIHFEVGKAGASLTNPASGNPEKYSVNSPLDLSGGVADRMGSLTHEMTHVSVSATFDNTPIILAFKKGMPEDEIIALGAKRTTNVEALKGLLDSDATFDARQRSFLNIQLGYMKQSKMGTYVANFFAAGKLTLAEKNELNALAAKIPNNSLLIEYDTVINQFVMVLHQWGIPQSNAFYKKAIAVATEAKAGRVA